MLILHEAAGLHVWMWFVFGPAGLPLSASSNCQVGINTRSSQRTFSALVCPSEGM